MAKILDGKELSLKIKNQLKDEIDKNILSKGLKQPCLAVIIVGNDMASKIYVNGKVKACNEVGIKSSVFSLDENATQTELETVISKLNKDKNVHGILLQLPLPKHLNSNSALNLIDPQKDVDGLTNTNLGKLVAGDDKGYFPCTPLGVVTLLKAYEIELSGKNVTVIGRSVLVGKSLALLLTKEDATVTLCHSRTKNLKFITKHSDIVVCAVGKAQFLKADMIKKNTIVVDVGMNRDEHGKVCGDCSFEDVSKIASFITPVPGGIGPMTITMLLKNLLKAYNSIQKQ